MGGNPFGSPLTALINCTGSFLPSLFILLTLTHCTVVPELFPSASFLSYNLLTLAACLFISFGSTNPISFIN